MVSYGAAAGEVAVVAVGGEGVEMLAVPAFTDSGCLPPRCCGASLYNFKGHHNEAFPAVDGHVAVQSRSLMTGF